MINKKKKIAVLFGGNSTEYEVSLRSVEFVLENLNKDKYDIIKIGITKEGRWLLYNGNVEKIYNNKWINEKTNKSVLFSPDKNTRKNIVVLDDDKNIYLDIDVVFPVLHGLNGEDGTVQGVLELANIAFVGCGVLSSAACMDKIVAHSVFDQAGIRTAKYVPLYEKELRNLDTAIDLVLEKLNFPVYVKPSRQGSSIGVSKANNKEELIESIKLAKKYDNRILVEETLIGKEVECAVMGNFEITASEIGEIVPTTEFYDYDSKYLDDSADLFIPARLENNIAEETRKIAIEAFRKIDGRGLARVDFFILENNDIILNEINTLPGLTSISMYPKLFLHGGMSKEDIIDSLITLALERKVTIEK